MKDNKNILKKNTILISLLIITICSYLYSRDVKLNYTESYSNHANILVSSEENRLYNILNNTIDNIKLYTDKESKEYEQKISYLESTIEALNLGEESIFNNNEFKDIISNFLEDEMIKYFIIDQKTKKVIQSTEKEFIVGEPILEDELNSINIYKYSIKYKDKDKYLIAGIKESDINNKVKEDVEEWIEIYNKNNIEYMWINEDRNYKILDASKNEGITEYKKEICNVMPNDIEREYHALKSGFMHTNLQKKTICYKIKYDPFDSMIGIHIYLDELKEIINLKDDLRKKNNEVFVIYVVVAIILITIIITLKLFLFKEAEKKKRILIQRENEITQKHYMLLKEKNNSTNKMVHDFKNHLLIINGLINDKNYEELTKYTTKLDLELDKKSDIIISENKIIDIILNGMISFINKEKIEFKYDIEDIKLDNIEDMDISIIVGNILENAIDSCKNSGKKYISLKIYEHNNNYIVIKLENSCDNEPIIKNNKLMTTKVNKDIHGYGMDNVDECLKKYDGNMKWEYDCERHIFSITIIIPMNK